MKIHVVIFFSNSGLGEFSRKKIPLWTDVLFLVEGRLVSYSRSMPEILGMRRSTHPVTPDCAFVKGGLFLFPL